MHVSRVHAPLAVRVDEPTRARAPRAAAAPPPSTAPAGPLSTAGVRSVVARLLSDERAVDRGLARAMRGGTYRPDELLALQLRVMRYTQELEVASRLVDKVTSAVKQTVQTQV